MSAKMSDEWKQAEDGICKLEAFHLPTTSARSQRNVNGGFIAAFFWNNLGFILASCFKG